jgi:hypothetical protein
MIAPSRDQKTSGQSSGSQEYSTMPSTGSSSKTSIKNVRQTAIEDNKQKGSNLGTTSMSGLHSVGT